MVDYKYKDIYNDTSVSKKMQIECSDGSVLNEEDWKGESAELTERLCSESEISFGRCEASTFKLRVRERVVPLVGKKISVSVTLEGADEAPFMMGVYKVDSDVPTADRRYRDIVAYDAMYDILNAEVSAWYNSLTFPITLRQFRDNFCTYVGVEQEEITLVNDDMVVEKTIDPGELPGKTVIEAICEINGCFGHITRAGKLRYVVLEQMIEGLYPADDLYPSDDLYPADPMGTSEVSKSMYLSCQYEDFICQHIDKLQIRQEENDIGAISGTGDNCYIIEDNFLVYGKSAADLQTIADNVLSVIGVVWYRPAQVEARGNPCLEVGDGILLHTTREDVYTYILQRTLKGIQALRDSYTAEGEEYRTGQVNGLQKQIIQLKGKTNTLTRTVDETRLEMKDINQNLSTQISINAQQILTKVSKDNIVSEINQTAESIKIKAERIDLVGVVNADELVSKYATIETLNVTKLELNNLIATKATIDSLNAVSGRVGSLEADHVTVSDLNGVSARLGTVEANYISAGTVKANYMEVANWTSSGVIKADRISAATIVNKLSSVDLVSVRAIGVSGYMNYKGTVVAWRTKSISGTVITYLGPED
ncbi:MAG TPA: hypothetical protein DGE56_08820 [Lachnospiraceae bacterium]|nr:hypothetical protein [Lachnospiraceae bacterium]